MKKLILALALLSSPAIAEQPPDPALLQKVLNAMQVQRNQALDAAAVAEARLALAADDLAKVNARIKELEGRTERGH